MAVITFLISTSAGNWIRSVAIDKIVPTWFTIISLLIFLVRNRKLSSFLKQIAVHAWMITLFSDENRAFASVMINLGHILGKFTSSSLFLSLNSVNWLNQHFFKDDKRTTPLITNEGYLKFMSILLMVFLFYLTFFVSEKVPSRKIQSYKEILKSIGHIL